VPDTRKPTRRVEEAPVRRHEHAVELLSQGQKTRVIERQFELSPQACRPAQDARLRVLDGDGKVKDVLDRGCDAAGIESGLPKQKVSQLVEEKGRYGDVERLALDDSEETEGLASEFLVSSLDPFDQDRSVNDDL